MQDYFPVSVKDTEVHALRMKNRLHRKICAAWCKISYKASFINYLGIKYYRLAVYLKEALMSIKALHWTAIPLRSIAAGELWR